MKRQNRFKNETGNVYTRLRVLEFDKSEKNQAYWKCFCDPELGGCGKVLPIRGVCLRNGSSKSCGCLQKEIASKYMKNRTGEDNPNYGKIWLEEDKRKMSELKKGTFTGKDNANYNPNLTDEERVDRRRIPGYKGWVLAVYKLDNYTCQKCGHRSGNLNAHHIESYNSNPTLRTEVSNGITLCEDCHKDFHHQYGKANNTRAQLIEFLRG